MAPICEVCGKSQYFLRGRIDILLKLAGWLAMQETTTMPPEVRLALEKWISEQDSSTTRELNELTECSHLVPIAHHEKPNILGVKWRSARDCVGIVAIQSYNGWKAYIGYARSWNEEQDAEYIAAHGAHLKPEEAHAFFPDLDATKYEM